MHASVSLQFDESTEVDLETCQQKQEVVTD